MFWVFLKKNVKIIGSIASILTVAIFLSSVEILISNIQGDSNIFIQPVVMSVGCFFWILYGYGKKDWFILIPNVIGLILGVITAMSAFF